jgi:signal transduction histidine kinase
MRISSLALRLVTYLLLSQTLAFLIAWGLIWMLIISIGAFDFDYDLNDMAYARVKHFVAESLERGPDGAIRIAPNDDLRALAQQTPTLRYAVFESLRGRALPGSSPDLVAAFEGLGHIKPRYMDFYFDTGSAKHLTGSHMQKSTPYGVMQIAAYGFAYQWSDLLYFFRNDAWQSFPYFGAIYIVSAIVASFAIRRGLEPLRIAAAQAAHIDIESLGQSVTVENIPSEIRPLVDAMNSALARLDAGVARMRRYTSNAAHELRTPLAIMRSRLENPEEPTFKLDLMRDASQLQAIVEQLLMAARLTERQAPLDQEVDLNRTIWQVVAEYTPLVLDSDRGIEFEASDLQVFVKGNQRALECVVANLIDNALRAEIAGRTVLVRVCDNAVVEIIDHGEGVALSDRDKIFEPFWRGSETTPGTGLGLAIAKELIEKLHGRIWVEATPGGGATFKIALIRLRD